MTPEIEKATRDFITATRDYNEAEQGFMDIKDQLTKQNLDDAKAEQKIEQLNKQLEELKTKCYNLEARIGIEERKAHKIFGNLESNWDYKMAKNNLIGARDKLDIARNYLERLIAKEAENDAAKH